MVYSGATRPQVAGAVAPSAHFLAEMGGSRRLKCIVRACERTRAAASWAQMWRGTSCSWRPPLSAACHLIAPSRRSIVGPANGGATAGRLQADQLALSPTLAARVGAGQGASWSRSRWCAGATCDRCPVAAAGDADDQGDDGRRDESPAPAGSSTRSGVIQNERHCGTLPLPCSCVVSLVKDCNSTLR